MMIRNRCPLGMTTSAPLMQEQEQQHPWLLNFFGGGLGTNIGGSHSRDKDLHMDDDEHNMYGNEEESTMAIKETSIIMAMRVLKTTEISKVITKMMIEYACKVKI